MKYTRATTSNFGFRQRLGKVAEVGGNVLNHAGNLIFAASLIQPLLPNGQPNPEYQKQKKGKGYNPDPNTIQPPDYPDNSLPPTYMKKY